ncbi:MAG: iron-sulfur cluster biosynthesis family protein [Lactobacillus iners]|nr:iron-sulfur cluster biosynthesis family protein [Lactobacillus iners]MCT7743375.1 iron-sulfur cluster biosynthesis family protein [Lactobacillus iners]MCT7771560.1 iron-sulfur cluster biosynthesis family protein [Lactobacillus iners]MCT7800695.1 iron-sulfur cluster biosynthesis family protein [Lactobacillus iners]MCT7846901.1 iron-sulfur cluster biosynthesis family protein [Lactobacillus iners]
MLIKKIISLNIKTAAADLLQNKIFDKSVIILALNDGSNKYSTVGGTCTIGANFQLVILSKYDSQYDIKIDNNMNIPMYTSQDELQYFTKGLTLGAKAGVLFLSSDEGIIDSAVSINNKTCHTN